MGDAIRPSIMAARPEPGAGSARAAADSSVE
jgi:hypothetical protein